MAEHVVIAVDAVGGDLGSSVMLEGVAAALAHDKDLEIILCGPANVVEPFAQKQERCIAQVATESIAMDEHPAIAVKSKKDASIVVAAGLLRNKECDALVSSGSTGAAVASALFCVGRIRGVERPAIATPIPSLKGTTVVLDSGAKVDAKPEHMVQSAIMGTVYAEKILKIGGGRYTKYTWNNER